MLFFSKDLLNELQRDKERTARVQRALIDEVHDLIQKGEAVDADLIRRITSPGPRASGLVHYDPANVFEPHVIREICIRYRLRFLPLRHYKPPLPYEALLKVRRLEVQNRTQLKNLYILAPAEAFHLEQKTDPLLFAGLDDGNYLLVHRWGRNLSWYRKLAALPLRNFRSLVITLVCLSLGVALALPTSWIAWDEQAARMTYSLRMYIFFMLVLASLFSVLFLHVRKNKNLSEDEWDSKYL